MKGTVLLALGSGLAPGPQECFLEQQRLLGSSPGLDERMGIAVDLAGTVLVAGTESDDLANRAGSVYVYRRVGGLWAEEAELFASDGSSGDEFGDGLAADGNTIVVGARGYDSPSMDNGAVYVFERSGTDWIETGRFVHPTGFSLGRFGHAVAIDGTEFVAGAPDTAATPGTGRAQVFSRDGNGWSVRATLKPLELKSGDRFGSAVAIDNGVIVVGATGDDDVRMDSGAAYVFEWSGSVYEKVAKLKPSDVAQGFGVCFGGSLAIEGGDLFVGAPCDGEAASFAGAIYRFQREGSAWVEKEKLIVADAAQAGALGLTLGLSGTRLVAGSSQPSEGPKSFVAYVFERDESGSWKEVGQLGARDPFWDCFGAKVAIDGDTVAVGSFEDSIAADRQGSVYTFDVAGGPECVTLYCTAKSHSCGDFARISAIGAPSASASSGFAVYATDTKAGRAGLIVYSDKGAASILFQGGTLCVDPQPLRRTVTAFETTGTPSACDGVLSIDMNAFARGVLGGHPIPALLVPGTEVYCQYIARDTVSNGSLLSDALTYTVGP